MLPFGESKYVKNAPRIYFATPSERVCMKTKDAVTMLVGEHREVKAMFEGFFSFSDRSKVSKKNLSFLKKRDWKQTKACLI
jgi:hypothetical protein